MIIIIALVLFIVEMILFMYLSNIGDKQKQMRKEFDVAITNPRIHIICGICGSNEFLSFKIKEKCSCDNEGNEYPAVYITRGNCSSLIDLGTVIVEEGK